MDPNTNGGCACLRCYRQEPAGRADVQKETLLVRWISSGSNKTLGVNTKMQNTIRTKTKAQTPTDRQLPRCATLKTSLITFQVILLSTSILMVGSADDFFLPTARLLRFAPDFSGPDVSSSSSSSARSTTSNANRSDGSSPFVWQPLPLRATFRPLNRQAQPSPPQPPRPPRPPTPPELVALISERSISDSAMGDNLFATSNRFGAGSSSSSSLSLADDFFTPTTRGASDSSAPASSFFQPSQPQPLPPLTTTTTSPLPTAPSNNFISIGGDTTPRPIIELDDDLPTRQPSNRFRPTKAPSDDADTTQLPASSAQFVPPSSSNTTGNRGDKFPSKMSSECFECICEASTNCNTNSRCQTSDVRHTRCGMFLISYDQWLATGLSRELVSREALARDPAADERAFYQCVITRDCSERLLAIYMAHNQKDCDQDGRVDCYDYAAIHHSGQDQCASESLLDSQYWNDFNACLGFGR